MADKKAAVTKKITKKEARKIAFDKLSVAFSEFSSSDKDKKFRSKLKKASKLFAADIAGAAKHPRLLVKIEKKDAIK